MHSESQSDADIWQGWLRWLPTAPPMDRPAPVFAQYRTVLLGAGAAEADADAQIAVIVRRMRTETDGWRVLFNNIYASPQPGFKTQPNALLVSAVAGRPAGQALDVSSGQGRNAVFLAVQGWDVTATDLSDTGLTLAAANAERAGVPIQTLLQSNHDLDLGTAVWDLIVLTYVPVPVASAEYAAKLWRALRPGGLVVVESFASAASAQSRRPVDIDPAALQAAFAGFTTLHFEATVALPDWEPDEVPIVRLVAEKPH